MTGGADTGGPAAERALELRVLNGSPTDEELAAVTAVLHAAVAEQGAMPGPPLVPDGRHWQRADRLLRGPLVPGPLEWRSF